MTVIQAHFGEVGVAKESFRPHWERFLRIGHSRFRVGFKGESWISGGTSSAKKPGWKSRDRFGSHTSHVGKFDVQAFCKYLGITMEQYEDIERAMRRNDGYQTIDDRIVDRIFTSMGEPDTYRTLVFYNRGSGQGKKPLRLYT